MSPLIDAVIGTMILIIFGCVVLINLRHKIQDGLLLPMIWGIVVAFGVYAVWSVSGAPKILQLQYNGYWSFALRDNWVEQGAN